MPRLPRTLLLLAVALGLAMALVPTALACGGLVAPDGDVRLGRAATLVAWHDGVERYMTSFTYEGNEANVGWIVPLPAVPDNIQAGGKWTLQRLSIETHPVRFEAPLAAAGATNNSAQVLQQVQIEALNITVLRGSGQAILDWCASNGFVLPGDTRAHLLIYAHGSPIFMAAKYDTAAVQARHQLSGDGAPVLITMHTAHPWIPLEVLALDGQQVQADLYLLTDRPLYTTNGSATLGVSDVNTQLPGAPGFQLAFQEPMNATLYHDLSTDRNMGWVPRNSWLTYLSLDAPASAVTYDLGVTSRGVIRLAPFGTAPMSIGAGGSTSWLPELPLGALQFVQTLTLIFGVLFVVALGAVYYLRKGRRVSAGAPR
jgi:hypothetical protein